MHCLSLSVCLSVCLRVYVCELVCAKVAGNEKNVSAEQKTFRNDCGYAVTIFNRVLQLMFEI